MEDSPRGVVYALHTMDTDSMARVYAVRDDDDDDSKGPKTMRELADDAEEEWRMGVRMGTGEVEVIEIGSLSGAVALNGGSRLNWRYGDEGVRVRRVNGEERQGKGAVGVPSQGEAGASASVRDVEG